MAHKSAQARGAEQHAADLARRLEASTAEVLRLREAEHAALCRSQQLSDALLASRQDIKARPSSLPRRQYQFQLGAWESCSMHMVYAVCPYLIVIPLLYMYVQVLEEAQKALQLRLEEGDSKQKKAQEEAAEKLRAAEGAHVALQAALAATEGDFRVAMQVPHMPADYTQANKHRIWP